MVSVQIQKQLDEDRISFIEINSRRSSKIRFNSGIYWSFASYWQALEPLDEDTLFQILTQPKNAIVKQYQKMLELDNVELRFEEDALLEIAKEAIERKTGARGLRSIIENIMLDVMFELPSLEEVTECIITKESVLVESKSNSVKRRWFEFDFDQ